MGALEYFRNLKDTLDRIPLESMFDVECAILTAIRDGKTIYTVGNGGSSSTASHLICDLVKGCMYEKGLKGFCLSDNTALITAYGNDEGYRRIFIGQMKALGVSEGDVLIAFSGSGQSQNIIDAMAYGKQKKMVVIGICGDFPSIMKQFANHIISVPCDDMQLIEDAHSAISHCLFRQLREYLNGK
jgi:D-sedoheptulose 7-phosphate isomerase